MKIVEKSGKFYGYDVNDNLIVKSSSRYYVERKLKMNTSAVASNAGFSVITEPVAPRVEFPINQRFEFVSQLVKMVATGSAPSAVITGEGGLGKTYTVVKTLVDNGYQDISEIDPDDMDVAPEKCFRVIKGFSTAKGLYRVLYENQNSIIVFDDCDSVLKDADALNLLKGALDSYDRRVITWNTSLRGDELPRTFVFKGSVIFISNLNKEKIDQALRTRSMCVDLSMTTDQKLERMEVLVESPEFLPEYDMSIKTNALEMLKENKTLAREISLRTLVKVSKICANNPGNWIELSKYMISQ